MCAVVGLWRRTARHDSAYDAGLKEICANCFVHSKSLTTSTFCTWNVPRKSRRKCSLLARHLCTISALFSFQLLNLFCSWYFFSCRDIPFAVSISFCNAYRQKADVEIFCGDATRQIATHILVVVAHNARHNVGRAHARCALRLNEHIGATEFLIQVLLAGRRVRQCVVCDEVDLLSVDMSMCECQSWLGVHLMLTQELHSDEPGRIFEYFVDIATVTHCLVAFMLVADCLALVHHRRLLRAH